jgi:hypothetical protein
LLSYVDRIQLVVPDRKAAVERWQAVFGAEQVSEDGSRFLNAHRATVHPQARAQSRTFAISGGKDSTAQVSQPQTSRLLAADWKARCK